MQFSMHDVRHEINDKLQLIRIMNINIRLADAGKEGVREGAHDRN